MEEQREGSQFDSRGRTGFAVMKKRVKIKGVNVGFNLDLVLLFSCYYLLLNNVEDQVIEMCTLVAAQN